MSYGTATINSGVPAKDLMVALSAPLTTAGFTLVDSYGTLPAPGWSAAAFGNGVFVALASGTSTVATSPDGITWTQRSLPVVTTWSTVVFGGGQFLAFAAGTIFAATSPDGITWTQRTLPSIVTVGLAYGAGLFVTLGQGTATAFTSPDGITWTQRTLPVSQSWSAVAYGGGMFAAVANSASSVAASSPDGITWTQRTLPASQNWSAVAYGGGVFAVVASGTTAGATSPDGITWTARTLPSSSAWRGLTYGGGKFLVMAQASTSAATSPDGITWTTQTASGSAVTWNAATYGAGLFVAVATSSSSYTTPDGVTWTQRSMTGTSNSTWADVYKSPAASNPFGSDWYLILRRGSENGSGVYYQVAEGYDLVNHKISNMGGTGVAAIPVTTTYANPALAATPDVTSVLGNNAYLPVTLGVAMTYWYSINTTRVIVGVRTTIEQGFYAGLYEDLLPAGVSQFPLVAARFPLTQVSGGSIGAGTVSQAGGFTREPLQALSSAQNFEACIHNGYTIGTVTGVMSSAYTPLPTLGALYGNAGAPGRAMIGSARAVTNTSDGVRGLLYGCVCSSFPSVAGDTITAGGKTYLRITGPTSTYGFFADQAV